jgi:hypothetical protein
MKDSTNETETSVTPEYKKFLELDDAIKWLEAVRHRRKRAFTKEKRFNDYDVKTIIDTVIKVMHYQTE